MNFKVAMVQMIKTGYIKNKFPELYDIMVDDFVKKYDKIMELFSKKKIERRFIVTNVYNLSVIVDYTAIKDELELLYKNKCPV
jgi:hypothetical protein